jgi:WhiB family redox-sensing transcriptional regulator
MNPSPKRMLDQESLVSLAHLLRDEYVLQEGWWEYQAACRDVPSHVFYSDDLGDRRRAKEVCMECPVRLECLATAISRGERYGIWGGMMATNRTRIWRSLKTWIHR